MFIFFCNQLLNHCERAPLANFPAPGFSFELQWSMLETSLITCWGLSKGCSGNRNLSQILQRTNLWIMSPDIHTFSNVSLNLRTGWRLHRMNAQIFISLTRLLHEVPPILDISRLSRSGSIVVGGLRTSQSNRCLAWLLFCLHHSSVLTLSLVRVRLFWDKCHRDQEEHRIT